MTKDELDTIAGLLTLASDTRDQSLALASKCQRCCIVDPGFPILWFGDLDTYLKTPKDKRAITVGVNPSGSELYYDKSGRFTHFAPLTTNHLYSNIDDYVTALNNYFNNSPLGWFKKGMDDVQFSYNDGNLIHIDCCSSIATRPSWSGLCKKVKDYLRDINRPIFEGFLNFLNPTTVFITSNKEEFSYIEEECKKVLGLPEPSYIPIYKYRRRAKEETNTTEK